MFIIKLDIFLLYYALIFMSTQNNLSVVVLTGAGISAESGLKTFRASDGLWEDHHIEDVATFEGFTRNPQLVHRFYNERRQKLASVEPNQAHIALAEFEQQWPGDFLLVTQNIDDLHERAGSKNIIHMHGELLKAQCTACDYVGKSPPTMQPESSCKQCTNGKLRPHVVWFGEMPLALDHINLALTSATTFISIGTSGQVYPAAGFVEIARSVDAHCIEVNLDNTSISSRFMEHHVGKATEVLQPVLDKLLTS